MSAGDKLRKVIFLLFLGAGAILGAVNPKEIEKVLQMMNQPRIEVIVPGKDEPK